MTLFLTLTTTIVGVSVALYQFKLPLQSLEGTMLVSALGILLLGITTFHRLLERSMQGTEYLRAINRIHHYFIERAPQIEEYLFWAAYDNIPHYDQRGVGGAETREVIMVIDCAVAGAALGLGVLLIDSNLIVLAVLLGLVGFALSLIGHQGYERFTLNREERRKSSLVRFPLPPRHDTLTGQQMTTNE